MEILSIELRQPHISEDPNLPPLPEVSVLVRRTERKVQQILSIKRGEDVFMYVVDRGKAKEQLLKKIGKDVLGKTPKIKWSHAMALSQVVKDLDDEWAAQNSSDPSD